MKVLSLLFLFLLSSCLEKKPGTNILTSGIFNQAIFSINNKDASGKTIALGEHLLTNPSIVLEVKVYNGTNYPYTELGLDFSTTAEASPSTNYLPTPEGAVDFPGFNGTCSQVLPPKQTCSIFIEITPREERRFNEFVKLSYKQYVELEEHIATISFLAGMPASLVFTNDQTQYIFGTPAGPNSIPVVERADAEAHQQTFEIKNMGGLSATNVVMELSEVCTSSLTNECPPGMLGAYRMEHNCPASIAPGATCQVTNFYRPLNKNPASGPTPNEIKEISYRSTITARYVTDSTGKQAALNAYFNSVSTDIQARFTTANSAVIFDQDVVSGNRDTRFITVRNVGYRTGFYKYLSLHDQSNNLIANCFKGSGSYLECVDTSLVAVPLSTLPFRIKDRHGCISSETNTIEIQVGQSCIFDLYFQPSITFLEDMPSQFQGLQLYATYDALWKAQETIVQTRFSSISAKSISAARVVVEKIMYNGTELYHMDNGLPAIADLARTTLQSPSFVVTKSLLVTFRNIGHTRATNTSLADGKNQSIAIGGSGTNVGSAAPYFYQSAVASDSICGFIEPNSVCTLSMNFAAIGMATTAQEDTNMFDSTDALSRKIKQFIISYKTGALFTDENIDGPSDYPRQSTQAHITAHLVRKGLLMELADDTRNRADFGNQYASLNDEIHTYVYLRNIGTGDITYLQAMNPPTDQSSSPNYSWSIIPTADPVSLGADYDCLNIVDTYLSGDTNTNVNPSTRTGNYAALPPAKSCVYTVRIKQPDRFKFMNALYCGATPANRNEEANRLFYQGGSADLWEVCRNNSQSRWQNVRFRYFDGDTTAPSTDHPSFGNQFTSKNFTFQYSGSWSRKIHFSNILPFLNATVYRPAFTLPDLGTGSINQATKNLVARWFYGTGTFYFSNEIESANTSPFIKGGPSRHPMQALSLFATYPNYDYVYYAGNVPQNSGNLDFTPSLLNSGSNQLRITAISRVALPGSGFTSPGAISVPRSLNANSTLGVRFLLNTNTAAAGEHGFEVTVTYETGEHNIPVLFQGTNNPSNTTQLNSNKKTRTFKALIIAKILATADHPKLTFQENDFEIVGNEGAAPTVTMGPNIALTPSWNTNALSSSVIMESVKIPQVPTANDVYAKKRITLTNNSTQTIMSLDYKFRSSIGASVVTTIPSTLNVVPAETTCSVGGTLNVGASCILTYKYQPRTADINQNYVLSFVYRSAANEYFMENIGMNLIPKAPGKLIAVGKSLQTINYKPTASSAAIVRDSFQLAFPTIEMTSIPTEINFTASAGALSKIEIENQEETKASLLLSYQKYLSKNNLRGYSEASPAGTSVVPLEAEYNTRGDGNQYAPIHDAPYLYVEASRPCFFGDDETNGAIPAHQKGFNKDSTSSCFLRFTLKANFDFLNRTLVNIDGDAMRDSAFELWYYSVARSSSAYIWFHLTGTVLPNSSNQIGAYGDVQALDNRTISISSPTFTPDIVSLGAFRGVRVYLSDTKSTLNNLYLTPPTTYFDIRSDVNGKWFASFNTGLQNGKFYYMKASAIRYDARFTHTATRFPGLLSGEYISLDSSTPILTVVVPPSGHYYVHAEKAIVDKFITGSQGNFTWVVSESKCISRTMALKNPDNVSYQYNLMNLNVWEAIKGIPTAHGYANHLSVAHWLSNPPALVDDYAIASTMYNPSSGSQTLSDISMFYFRDTTNRNAPVRMMVGGVPGTGNSDYFSLITPVLPFSNARCMISLE